MENDLIMNHLPLPQYFDGYEWQTKLKSNRKSIPKYLHEDLPELKHMYIKQIFKNMGKLNCPNIQFFHRMIKKKQGKQKKYQTQQNSNKKFNKKSTVTYDQVKQQLQYALLTTDRNSNILDELVQKAHNVHNNNNRLSFNSNNFNNSNQFNSNHKQKQQQQHKTEKKSQTSKSFRSKSYSNNKKDLSDFKLQNTKTKYFQNTVDLVFKNRRNKFINNLKNPFIQDQIPENFEKRFKQLYLIEIKNQNLS